MGHQVPTEFSCFKNFFTEIGLPKENGRAQILTIHTRKMRTNEKLHQDVDLKELAALTKNFSGAEIEGLVRAAQSRALNRYSKKSVKLQFFEAFHILFFQTCESFIQG